MTETAGSLEDLVMCVRYGLMEYGGFTRYESLNRKQRAHMLVQERANLVLFNLRNRADTTDSAAEISMEQEPGEEEDQVQDPEVSPGNPAILVENLRRDQNISLAAERWAEASQLQTAIMMVIDATSTGGTGMTMEVVTGVRNICQRLFRFRRNRGLEERAEKIQTYVRDMDSLMR